MALRAVTSNGVAITPSSLTVSGTLTGSSGTATAASISPTINQSGTAGYTALDINPTESATGSGTKLLQRWAVGGLEVGRMSNNGSLWTTSLVANAGTGGLIGLSSALGVTPDVQIFRDATDILALRRGTNAQTFRVYNTYTDGSNYERGFADWTTVTNQFSIGTQQAGSGTARTLGFVVNGATAWAINGSRHLIAFVDNTYDIGASGANRPRNLYVAAAGVFGSAVTCLYYRNAAYYTVATLPTATGVPSARVFVNDSTVAAAGNFGAVVAGGGANIVPVFSDGTNWRIG